MTNLNLTQKGRYYIMSLNKFKVAYHVKTDLVVKTNQLNSAVQNLSLPELRIIQLAIVDARETGKGLDTKTPLRIDAMRYANAFDTTRQNAYILMKQSEETLLTADSPTLTV